MPATDTGPHLRFPNSVTAGTSPLAPQGTEQRKWQFRDDFSWTATGFGGPTPSGSRIGPVYTPPECRGRGYASNLVAGLSQMQLDAGRDYVFLFTDLANPTSNKIYVELGYERVCDSVEYGFERP